MRLAEDAGGGAPGASVRRQPGGGGDDIEVAKAYPTCGQAYTCRPHGLCWCLALEYRPRRRRGQPEGACVCPACRRRR